MNVDIIVAVWGDWHIGTLEASTLPTSLADGNLPAFARKHKCRLRIFTRGADVERIEKIGAMSAVRALMPVEIAAMTAETDVGAPFHLQWWHQAGSDAKAGQAMVLNLPPDVVFPDGCIPHLVEPLASGRVAVLAPPQLRVVEETLLAELPRLRDAGTGAIRLAPRETVALGIRHLHPLFAQVVEGNPIGRPGIEHLWPAGTEGFVLCQTTREIIAYNPAACEITDRFLVSNAEDMSSIHTSVSSDDAFFLSLAPLMKDLGLALRDHPTSARFLARWSTHPDNDVPLADYLPDHLVRLEATAPTEAVWREAEERARAWVREYRRWRNVFHAWRGARELGCSTAGRLIGLAVNVLDVPSYFMSSGQVLAFLPSDEALSALGAQRIREMVAVGGEDKLAAFIRAHFAEMREGWKPSQGNLLRTLDGVERPWKYDGPTRVYGRTSCFRVDDVVHRSRS